MGYEKETGEGIGNGMGTYVSELTWEFRVELRPK